MERTLRGLLIALGACGALSSGALADPIPYNLGSEAMFEAGCLPPCMCPVLIRESLQGTFTLAPGVHDGVYQHYEVRDVSWRLSVSKRSVRGSGVYKVGGAAGDRQQLVLDLTVEDGPSGRYDSGLVSGGDAFPSLRLPVALHGFFCHDSVYGVVAEAHGTADVPPEAGRALALRASPNPFVESAEIEFSLTAGGSVDLRIYDLLGRDIRTLMRSRRLEPGPHTVRWDGRRDDGSRAPAGVYFVGLGVAGREERGRLVRF